MNTFTPESRRIASQPLSGLRFPSDVVSSPAVVQRSAVLVIAEPEGNVKAAKQIDRVRLLVKDAGEEILRQTRRA